MPRPAAVPSDGTPRADSSAYAARPMDASLALRLLVNPIRRVSLPGLARGLHLAAVWPEGQGFSARLEVARRPGVPVVSARWRHGLEVWPFPSDPALPALATLVEQGYRPLSHRLGRRATLRSPDDPQVTVHLRPPRTAEGAFRRWSAIEECLQRADVPVARIRSMDRKLHAARLDWIESTLAVRPPSAALMKDLGQALARVHAAPPPPGLPVRGAGAALEATVRRLGMAIHSGTASSHWLERRLERWHLLGAPPRRSARALVHGDLSLGQVVWNGAPVILDWDRSGLGDPEEDLGSMAAHLYWESGPEAAATFGAFRAGYVKAGGTVKQPLFEFYSCLGLVQVLAMRAFNEASQPRVRAGRLRWSRWPSVVATW